MKTASKKVINAWAMYDWANSAYSLIITSAIFPAYYTAIAPPQVQFIGRTYDRAALASYAISFSILLMAVLSPILSSIADYKGNKKSFMKFFCYMGAMACCSMIFFTKENVSWGIVASIIASVGWCGSIVFYNSYLPEIADEKDQDDVSAKGFSLGYIGSVILMIVCLIFIMLNDKMNLGWRYLPVRLSFVAVGIWWAGFAQITFKWLPPSKPSEQDLQHNIITNGFHELKKVWNQLKDNPQLSRFLRAFFFFNMGVMTVMYLATYFASDELKMGSTELIVTVLIIQVVAILGATLFAKLSDKTNNIFTLSVLIIIWIAICFFASKVTNFQSSFSLCFCIYSLKTFNPHCLRHIMS